jgi:N-acetylglucosamine kinase-like BadF-type ATPase
MVLAVDLGQSGTRIRWSDGHYESTRAKVPNETSLDTLRDVFEEVAHLHEGALRSDVVALSLTALYGNVPDPKLFGLLANEYFSAEDVAVIDDGLAGLIGALRTVNGVTLSVGSGVVAVAGRNETFSHADGLGHIFGDIGGGYWLGRQSLERALATRQGREEDTELLAFLSDEINAVDQLRSNVGEEAHALCISTARKVLEGAELNIVGALTIRNYGARQLANTVKAAWLSAGGTLNEGLSLALLGGLSRNRGYEEAITDSVERLLPGARITAVSGNHLDGAIAIAMTMKEDVPPLLRWWHKS